MFLGQMRKKRLMAKVLIDSGASDPIILEDLDVPKLKRKRPIQIAAFDDTPSIGWYYTL